MTARALAPELMAPAGSAEAAFAAFQHGANAVYAGMQRFSARAEAANFDPAALDRLVAFAHRPPRPRRVYVALNTLVLQRELPDLVDQLGILAEIGVDAVILQDLGAADLARRHFPSLRRHASTQLAVHNREGVEALRELGFARATLARELTVDEIAATAAVPGIEVESFIHGALCYCYSGLCLFSSLATGRSGNRGRCAYSCRDRFAGRGGGSADRAGRFLFSMKDLALPRAVWTLRDAGVASLKIEGRMKSPLYVAAVTAYYRRLLDGGLSAADEAQAIADIQSVFSRPWTPLYADGPRRPGVVDAETVGHRGTPAGTVERVLADPREGARLRFRTTVALEKHDGLQIDLPGEDRPFGFPVDRLCRAGGNAQPRETVRAEAGEVVEVGLPRGAPRLPAGAPVYRASSQEVRRRYRLAATDAARHRTRAPLRVTVTLGPTGLEATGEAGLGATGEAVRATVTHPAALAPARDPAGVEAAVLGAFAKLGDTPWELTECRVVNPLGLFAPVSTLNEVRRALAAALAASADERRAARRCAILAALPEVSAPPAHEIWQIKTDRPDSLDLFTAEDWTGVGEIILEIGVVGHADLQAAAEKHAATRGRDAIRFALPAIMRSWDRGLVRESVDALWGAGWRRWQVANLWALALLPAEARELVTADWPLYTMNAAAGRAWREAGLAGVTLSPEDGLENLGEVGRRAPDAVVVVYQDTPLFVSETCVRLAGAGSCPGVGRCDFDEEPMRSSRGDRVRAINRRCRTWVIGESPLCWAAELPALRAAGARAFRVDFLLRRYAPAEARDLWRRLRAGHSVPGTRLGNLHRGLQ